MGRHTILLVENGCSVRDLAADVLRHEGYEVLEAADGREAIQVIEQHEPLSDQVAVVLLDLMLPKVTGLQILERLQETNTAAPPVVAMSASGQHLGQAARAGANEVLAKSFDITTLLDTVAHYCPPEPV